jgi:hypothetical protein
MVADRNRAVRRRSPRIDDDACRRQWTVVRRPLPLRSTGLSGAFPPAAADPFHGAAGHARTLFDQRIGTLCCNRERG